jgi:DNA topoisomerase-1
VLGAHPRDRQPVELHAGRYGPYVKHGTINATLPNRDAVDTLSLDEAVALVDEKAGRETRSPRRSVGTRAPRKAPLTAAKPSAGREAPSAKMLATAGRKAPALRTAAKNARPSSREAAGSKSKTVSRTAPKATAVAHKRTTRAAPAIKAPVAAIARKSTARDAAKKTKRR